MPPAYQIVWKASDEKRLFALQASLGNQWSEIADRFSTSGKSSNDCKNRYNSGLRKVERSLLVSQNEAAALLARYALAIKNNVAGSEAGDDARFEDGLIELASTHVGSYSKLLPDVKQVAARVIKKVLQDEHVSHLSTGRRPSIVSASASSLSATPSTSTPAISAFASTPASSSSSSFSSASAHQSLSTTPASTSVLAHSPLQKRGRKRSSSSPLALAQQEQEAGYDSDAEEVIIPKAKRGRPRHRVQVLERIEIGRAEHDAVDALFSLSRDT